MKHTRKIAMINQKGGVGKTTSSINIGAALAKRKKRVLLIDLDPQAHLTYGMGIKSHELDCTIYDLMKDQKTLKQVSIEKFGMCIIPSSLDLSGAEIELSSIPGREFILKEVLEKYIKEFDYLIIDCPPSLGLLTLNALTTANEIFIPLQTEFFALHGLKHLIETVDIVKKRLNNDLRITGIIGTRFDSRKTLNRQVIEAVEKQFKANLLKTLIRENISLAEAPSFGQPIFNYKNSSNGATDYFNLSKEIIERE